MTKKVAFLFGGPGAEHEVSCATAYAALPQFPSEYELLPVFITKDKKWVVAESYVAPHGARDAAAKLVDASGVPVEVGLDALDSHAPWVVFLGLHGQYGEDGTIQALLAARGIVYTGSDAKSSELAMNKPKVLQLLQDEGLQVPEFLEVTKEMPLVEVKDFAAFSGYPVVVLPADSGSSVGVRVVNQESQIEAAIDNAKKHSDRVLVSKYIQGRELSCGVLVTDKNTLVPLPATEIKPEPTHMFFDYEAKYTPGECQEITPAELDTDTMTRVQAVARKVHQLVGADGYSRTDMIITDDGMIYVLEINTLPGLTPTSILPQQAKAFGLNFTELLRTMCEYVDRSDREYLTATLDSNDEE